MTAKEIQKRNERANQLRVIQVDENSFFVESSDGKICYKVAVSDEEVFCTCGDFARGIKTDQNPEKKEIVNMAAFVKLDAMEAQILTGADVPTDQADVLEGWGSSETIITCSEGVLARHKGRTTFVKFTNRVALGRMGRGDTVMGSYLARRLDHSVDDSLRFAAALASIKMESAGPFKGSLNDVIERMDRSVPVQADNGLKTGGGVNHGREDD